jgi:hypothetical protein
MDKVIDREPIIHIQYLTSWEDLTDYYNRKLELYVADDTSTVDLRSWSLKPFIRILLQK